MLLDAKEKAGHGNWLPWLGANFPGEIRTAQSYMQLASNTQTSASLKSIDSALKALAEPRSAIDMNSEAWTADQQPRSSAKYPPG